MFSKKKPSSSSATSNKASQIDELRRIFKRFDIDNDGKISSSELRAMITSLGQTATEAEISNMISAADKDRDGFISLDEFIEINIKDMKPDEALQTLRDTFSMFDTDGSGLISAEKLHKVLRRLGEECSVSDCIKMISRVDADGDAMISFSEFEVMMNNGRSDGGRLRKGRRMSRTGDEDKRTGDER